MECKGIGKDMHFIANSLKRMIDNKVAEYGLTSVQSRVLHFIAVREEENIPLYQKDLEGMFDVRRSTVTSVIQLLEKNGYIKRESVETDARLKQLKLTDYGKETSEIVHKIIVAEEQRIFKCVTEEEEKTFFEVIEKISEAIRTS